MQKIAFRLEAEASLTPSDFDQSPLWAGYYEPDDVGEIVRWGFPEPIVRAALDSIDWQDDHYFPLPIEAVRSDWMRGKLYAVDVVCADGSAFPGYVGEGRDYLNIFAGDDRYVLSSRIPELNLRLPGPAPFDVCNRVTNEKWEFSLPAKPITNYGDTCNNPLYSLS